MNDLTIGGIIIQGFAIGIKNLFSLIGAVLRWIVTIWIPYLNVGTTIALFSIVIAMSKGSIISSTEIFDRKYRKDMGEFFLVLYYISIGVSIGFIFLIIPGLVMAVAWGQAVYLHIDKKLDPMDAVKASDQITYGEKWTICIGTLLLVLLLFALIAILSSIGFMIAVPFGATIVVFLGVVVVVPILLGASAHIYCVLVQKIEQTG